jgi:His-Xaa-Ser repeat protein HxsA
MKKSMRALSSAMSAAFVITGTASDAERSGDISEVSSFSGLQFEGTLNSEEVPMFLAAHSSHRSHGSHGSHRSSSGGSARPVPSSLPPPAPAPTPRPSPKSDPLGQQPKPKATYKPPIPDDPSLLTDSALRADVVRRVQLALLLQGDYDGAIDGVMGPATRDAIDIFKIKRGLPRGGYLDKATLDALGVPLRSK